MVSRLSALLFLSVLLGTAAFAQPAESKASPDEMKAAQAIMAAPDPAKKLRAGEDFIKKFPKSTLRPRVAHGLVDQISAVTDGGQKVTLAQEFQQSFNEPSEQEEILSVLIEGLTQARRLDEVFTSGSAYLAKNPDSLPILFALTSAGADEVRKQNSKFVPDSIKYGTRAIELIESDKKPLDFDEQRWNYFKTTVLPSLHGSVGLLFYAKGDQAEAKTHFGRASTLTPLDPYNFIMLVGLLQQEYQTEAKRYQTMPDTPSKADQLKKVQAIMDSLIDADAHAIALSEGNTSYDTVRQQFTQDLEMYYKFRHNGSAAGMQELINKYKPAPKP